MECCHICLGPLEGTKVLCPECIRRNQDAYQETIRERKQVLQLLNNQKGSLERRIEEYIGCHNQQLKSAAEANLAAAKLRHVQETTLKYAEDLLQKEAEKVELFKSSIAQRRTALAKQKELFFEGQNKAMTDEEVIAWWTTNWRSTRQQFCQESNIDEGAFSQWLGSKKDGQANREAVLKYKLRLEVRAHIPEVASSSAPRATSEASISTPLETVATPTKEVTAERDKETGHDKKKGHKSSEKEKREGKERREDQERREQKPSRDVTPNKLTQSAAKNSSPRTTESPQTSRSPTTTHRSHLHHSHHSHRHSVALTEEERLARTKQKLSSARRAIISELLSFFPINPSPTDSERETIILNVTMPNNGLYKNYRPDALSTALGYVAHVVYMIACYLGVCLPWQIDFAGARSAIWDPFLDKRRPLFGKRFHEIEPGLILLNRAIVYLCGSQGVHVPLAQQNATLPNLLAMLRSPTLGMPGPIEPMPSEKLFVITRPTLRVVEPPSPPPKTQTQTQTHTPTTPTQTQEQTQTQERAQKQAKLEMAGIQTQEDAKRADKGEEGDESDEDFIVVDHSVVPTPEQNEEFEWFEKAMFLDVPRNLPYS